MINNCANSKVAIGVLAVCIKHVYHQEDDTVCMCASVHSALWQLRRPWSVAHYQFLSRETGMSTNQQKIVLRYCDGQEP